MSGVPPDSSEFSEMRGFVVNKIKEIIDASDVSNEEDRNRFLNSNVPGSDGPFGDVSPLLLKYVATVCQVIRDGKAVHDDFMNVTFMNVKQLQRGWQHRRFSPLHSERIRSRPEGLPPHERLWLWRTLHQVWWRANEPAAKPPSVPQQKRPSATGAEQPGGKRRTRQKQVAGDQTSPPTPAAPGTPVPATPGGASRRGSSNCSEKADKPRNDAVQHHLPHCLLKSGRFFLVMTLGRPSALCFF